MHRILLIAVTAALVGVFAADVATAQTLDQGTGEQPSRALERPDAVSPKTLARPAPPTQHRARPACPPGTGRVGLPPQAVCAAHR